MNENSGKVDQGELPKKLRIALVVHHFPVVSETFVIEQAAGLLAAGHDVRVLTTGQSPPPPDGFQHRLFASAGLQAITARASDDVQLTLRDVANALGMRGLRGLGFGVCWAASKLLPKRHTAVARMLAAERPFDVIHCQFTTEAPGILRNLTLGTLPPTPLVVHMRGMDITRHVAEAGENVFQKVFRRADLLVANCMHFRDRAAALGADPDKIEVIGSPIDTTRFRPPEARPPLEGRPVRLVAVGRLVEKKGFEDAIGAVQRLREQGREVTLDILGEGPLRIALERQIENAGLQEWVSLHGAAAQEKVIAFLHRSDIAMAPSVRAGDGDEDAPVNTLKEAMATGLPVVATRHGGIPELVIPGENGLLVPERDAGALADAVADLMARPEDWADLGRAGRQKVIADYDRNSVLERQVAAYNTAIRRHRKKRGLV